MSPTGHRVLLQSVRTWVTAVSHGPVGLMGVQGGSCLNPVHWARGQLPLNGRHSPDRPRAEPHSTRPQGLDTVLGVRTRQCVQPALLLWTL